MPNVLRESHERFQLARIFHQNIINTTHASRIAQNPEDRAQIVALDDESQANIDSLPALFVDCETTLKEQADNMKVIGKIIKEDNFYNTVEEDTAQTNIVQNMLDGFKYTFGLLKNVEWLGRTLPGVETEL
ncbi:Oidioi.mRNA.OKI2018_I69.chr1.g162.t1.cds [Oikopleura dioica]|uniref:Oidioi.mRNA.OKI2018_I69.chr1.g162.t1.cds n=1 Tax=Oikopleura dioica TaxID=34765 RepID=A0ABN7STA1_OIKDI|nr:Oidioi.mRNA.OKI2018_I69.chr1.g162.t1.cds [Oikopleura dioica]